MRTCKQYKYVSARTHSSTAILQHQRAGLRARGSRSIAVIIIIIFEFNIIIILCISSANSVLGCRSVSRSVGRVGVQVRFAMQLSRRRSHQHLAEKLTQRTGIFARSTRLRQQDRSRYSSLLFTAVVRYSSTRIISCAFRAQVRIKRCSRAAAAASS